MSQQSLTILTPHGRRHTVKLTPNTTILEVLEQVCQKYKLEPNRHILKHHNKIVDLSRMFRFSGLPNNGLLELEETDQVRTEAEVQIVLQTESGERLTGSFPPSYSLHNILLNLCPGSAESEKNSVVVFMRKEVFGADLESTTLKNLGLTSGKAMLRLLHRSPAELRVQANVSAPLVPRIIPVAIEESQKSPKASIEGENREEPKEFDQKLEEPMQVDEEESSKDDFERKDEKVERVNSPEMKKLKFEGETGESSKASEISADEMKKLEEEIKIVGPNDAVIFSLDATPRVHERDLPDSFFDLTIDDVRLLLRDLKDQVKNNDDAPLLTAKLREMENDKRILKLLQYKKTVIRIQFPDRHVLQVTFNPIDTIETVMDFVRERLAEPQMDFHLFTTPPKEILPPNARLVELKCVPQAVIHFGVDREIKSEGGKFLEGGLLQDLTSPDAAILLAMRSRGLKLANVPERQSVDEEMQSLPENSTPKPRVPENFNRSSASSGANVPKWFKISK